MQQPSQLNLLIIDDNQLYAEQLISVLEDSYYKKVNLGFLDDKEELLKLLRQSWDILIMGKAYDLTLPQVKKIITEHGLDLPILAIIPEDGVAMDKLDAKEQSQIAKIQGDDKTDKLLPLFIYWGAIDAVPKDRVVEMAVRVHFEHLQVLQRTALNQLRQVLNDAEQRANILIKNSKSAVAYIEDGLHIYANDPYLEMFGFKSLEDLMGVPVVDLIASNNIKDFKQFLKDFEKGNRNNVEFKFESIRTDGSTFAAKLQLAAATYEGHPCQQIIIQPDNQGNSAELAKKLAEVERLDPLTRLYNRRGFEQLLPKVRDAVVAQKLSNTGLVSIKIDDIGKINSTYGIQGVDTIVTTVSQLLRQQLVPLLGEENISKGYVSRYSDSNFTVILPNTDEEKLTQFCQHFIATIADTLMEVNQRTLKVTVSIGATMITASSPDVDTLMNRVSQAVGTAIKESNNQGGGFYLFDPSMLASSDDVALLEALKTALDQSKFDILYQPIYDVEQDVSNMFEVFLRLPLADGTQMSPDKFVDIATQHQLMDKIDRWVLIRACKDLRDYRAKVDPTARILVHLSPTSLMDESLPSFLAQLNKAVGSNSAGTITVQFSEATVNDYLTVAAKQTQSFNQVGCHVGMYNFGSAVNAIELLEFIKPQLVRLDRSYIKDLGNSENVETITSLVKQVNEHQASCLMAFIEDPAAMSAAWTVGARYLQGNYLQAPSDHMYIQTEQS